MQLIDEIVAYSETSSCRRKFLLHYFGESFDDELCDDMCDNCKHPKEKIEASEEIGLVLESVKQLHEKNKIQGLIEFIIGRQSKEMKDFKYSNHPLFGQGEEHDELFWHSIIRQTLLHNLLYKDVELYGVLKLTPEGHEFLKNPWEIHAAINNDYSHTEEDESDLLELSGGGGGAAMDETLLAILKEIRHEQAKKLKIKPWVIFSDPSLQDMTVYYPVTMEDMLKISGVSKGKAEKYAQPFIDFIGKYVEENEIDRPSDFLVRQVADKSKNKITIIQNVDRKVPLEDVAQNLGMTFSELMDEMYVIVNSGTKLNIDYYINEKVDEYSREDIYDFFMAAESDSLENALKKLSAEDDEITFEEIQLVRIKFISDIAN